MSHSHADRGIDARPVADDGEGQSCQVAQEGGRHRQIRRRHRRDRDRQSHHGSRGGRRGHARQDPGAGRHRRRRGQYADRHDPRPKARTPQRSRTASGAGRKQPAKAEQPRAAGKGRRIRAARREGRAGEERRSAGAGQDRHRQAAVGRDHARARSARRHRDGHHDHARGACATPWPRKCAAIPTCS